MHLRWVMACCGQGSCLSSTAIGVEVVVLAGGLSRGRGVRSRRWGLGDGGESGVVVSNGSPMTLLMERQRLVALIRGNPKNRARE